MEIQRRTDFMRIPAIIEKKTSPSLYSFFNGLKNVLKSNGTESNDATYLLKLSRKLKTPPITSLYQNKTR